MIKQLRSEEEATKEAERIVNSVLGKRWMIAVWCVEQGSDGKNVLRLAGKVTWEFPTGDFDESLRLLRACLDEELQPVDQAVPPPPLELAPFLREREGGEVFDDLGSALRTEEAKETK